MCGKKLGYEPGQKYLEKALSSFETLITRIDWLLIELPLRWEKCPETKTLWMG